MKIGNFVKIKCGCSKWLKDHRFWSDNFGSSIDGLVGKIENDYTEFANYFSFWNKNI